jgi:uncharacterized protein DUF4203
MATPTFTPALLIILFGLIVWLMGYGIWRIALALMGAVYGFMIGTSLVGSEGMLAILIGVIAAIILALLAYFLWSVVALIYGMFLGMGIGAWAALVFNAKEGGQTMSVFVIVGAILGLILALFLKDQVIMLATAFSGAAAVLYGARLMLPISRLTTGSNYLIGFIVWIVAGIIGYTIQSSLFSSRLTGTYGGYNRRA